MSLLLYLRSARFYGFKDELNQREAISEVGVQAYQINQQILSCKILELNYILVY
jgi:hypothetical protein